jgi:O-antigen/teichoic acid export membrane protein
MGAGILYASSFVFTTQELGYFKNLIFQGALLQLTVLMGVANLVLVYMPKYPDNDKRKSVLMTLSLFVPLVFTILYTIPYLFFKEGIIHHYQAKDRGYISTYYLLLPVLVLLMGYMTLLDAYLLSQQKVAISTFMREVALRIAAIALLVLFAFKAVTFHTYIISNVLAYLVPVLAMLLIAMRTKGFGLSLETHVFTKSDYKSMLHFSWYHLLFGVTMNVMGYLDPLMLGALDKDGMSTIGIYQFAIFIVAVMVIPYRAMTTSTYTPLNNAYIANDNKKLFDLFHRSGINILIVAIGMFLLIGGNLDNAIALLAKGKGFEVIKPIVFILMLGRVVDMATGLNSELISVSKYYKFNFRISFLLVVLLLVFNRILIPKYGIYGAAWGATLSIAFFNLAKMVFLWWKMQLHPFSSKSLLVLLAGAGAWVAIYFIPTLFNPIVDSILRSGIIVFVYACLLIWFKPSEDLNVYLRSIKENKRLF